MADIVTRHVRSRMMAKIRNRDTNPELVLRHKLHQAGFRYRLHVKNLPGTPDIVLPKHRAAIFVHGCFWHGHNCKLFRWPASRQDFWRAKITGNRLRDARARELLLEAGWRVLTVWECALKRATDSAIDNVISTSATWLQSEKLCSEVRGRC